MNLWKLYDIVYDRITVVDDKHAFVRNATDEDAKNLPWAINSTPKKNPEAIRLVNSDKDRDFRIRCLELAISAAKSGSSFGESIPKIAQAYYLFSLGEVPPADPFAGLSFEQRLDALIQEFLRGEIEDPAKIKHGMGECYARLDAQYPDKLEAEDPANIADDRRNPADVVQAGPAETDALLHNFRIENRNEILDAIREHRNEILAEDPEVIRMQHKDIRA